MNEHASQRLAKPAPKFSEVERDRQRAIGHFNGLVTLCFPKGISKLYFTIGKVEQQMINLARLIGEPVQIAANFGGGLGPTVCMYCPAKTGLEDTPGWPMLSDFPIRASGGWFHPLSLLSETVPTNQAINNQIDRSDAPWLDPVMVVDFGDARMLPVPTQDRLDHLAKAIVGWNIHARFNRRHWTSSTPESACRPKRIRGGGVAPPVLSALDMICG